MTTMTALRPYSREQAIADCALIDVTGVARKVGLRHSTALTLAAWDAVVTWTDADEDRKGVFTCQDEDGRLRDALWHGRCAMRTARPGQRALQFSVYVVPRRGKGCMAKPVRLVVRIEPGDLSEPVLTFMLPSEA